ncbi:MAG: hypothetical protein L3J56_01015 [Bacteroidales bacterium]|nr:hypothetical protein [Bacteroidales bacterium]
MQKTKLPDINKRIKDLIRIKTDGNKTEFGRETGLVQQRLTRLFIKDKRTGKYPFAGTDMVIKILNRYIDVNARWLLTGEGYMNETDMKEKNEQRDKILDKEKDYIIELQKDVIASLKEQISFFKEKI